MSTDERQSGDVLERNVEELLRHAHEPPEMDPDARERVLARLRERAEEKGREEQAPSQDREPAARPGRRERWVAAAVFAAAAIGLLWIAGRGTFGLEEREPPRHENRAEAPRAVELEDGTELVLKSGAALAELGPRRVRLLEGEVLFDVAEGEAPFVVESDHGEAVALGTRFLLRAGAGELWAAVARGRVRLSGAAGEETLGAGEEGVISGAEAPVRRPAPRLSHLTSWAREARRREERPAPGPVRRGNLLAREPNRQEYDSPLPMRRLTVDVRVESQVARVAVDQTFFNHRRWQLEGVYWFPLPPRAAISRLAMYVDGRRTEAGIVRRQRAREIYDSIVYRRRDPALLEWMAGNIFRVRIFPLPPRLEKRILLSYTQTLERLYDDVRLEVPVPAIDLPVDHVEYRARVVDCADCEIRSPSHPVKVQADGADQVVTFTADDHAIGDDLVLQIRHPSQEPELAVYDREQRYFLVRARPEIQSAGEEEPRPRRWVILNDTSASRRGLERRAQVHLIDQLLGELDERDEVALLAFDATVREMEGGFAPVAGLDRPAAHRFLQSQSADGVGYTDLGRGLERAAELLEEAGDGFDPHILYVGDGLVTGGERELDRLEGLVRGRARVVAVGVGETRDQRVLEALAAATGGLATSVSPSEDLGWRAFDLVATLNTPRVFDLRASLIDEQGREIEAELYLDSPQLAHGEEASAVARGSGALPRALRLRGELDGQPWQREISLDGVAISTDAGYLPRLWAQRRIDALTAAGAEEHREEITELALENRLLTPFTSLLVLEDEQMYEEHGVQPGAAEEGWAAYPAPDRIQVVREPASGDDLAGVSLEAVLAREPAEILGGAGGLRGLGRFGSRGGGPTVSALGGGSSGPGAEAAARGGGGSGMSSLFEEESEELSADAPADAAEGEAPPSRSESDAQPRHVVPVDGTFEDRAGDFGRPGTPSDERDGYFRTEPAPLGGLAPGGGRVYPVALHHDGDPRLDDMSAHVPGLFTDDFDRERMELLRRADAPRGTLTPRARRLIERSRERMLGRRYRAGDGTSIAFDEGGRFVAERPGLPKEEIVYDGDRLHHVYPGLDLAVEREVGSAEPALFAQVAPFVLPDPESLARWYEVSTRELRTLVLALPERGETLFEIDLDQRHRPVEIRRMRGGEPAVWRRFAYRSGEITVRGDAVRRELAIAAEPPAVPADPAGGRTTVEMPLRHPERWKQRDAEVGSAAWRRIQRQLLASYAALGDGEGLRETIALLAERVVALSPGELALASRGLRRADPAAFEAALSGVGADPVARYLRAARAAGTAALDELAGSAPGTLVGELASYRALVRALPRSPRPAVLDRYRRFAAASTDPRLRYVAAYLIEQRYQWESPAEAAAGWDRVAEDGPWWALAQREAARSLYQRGDYDAAVRRYETLYERSAELGGAAPPVDPTVRSAFRESSRGEAGWRLFWSRWRERVFGSDDPELLLSFLQSARLVAPADLERAAARAASLRLRDPSQVMAFADVLAEAGRTAEARALLEPAIERTRASERPNAALLARGSRVAEAQGRVADAADLLAAAMEAEGGARAPLSRLRSEYGRLLRLRGELALRSSGEEREQALERALRTVADWRALDPANPDLDRRAARLLFSVGRPEQARRYLTTSIERRPGEASAYQTPAEALEEEGRLAEAERLWAEAAEREPTNPTWLLRRAQALAAMGREEEARPLLERIAGGTWHERFGAAATRAERLLEQLP